MSATTSRTISTRSSRQLPPAPAGRPQASRLEVGSALATCRVPTAWPARPGPADELLPNVLIPGVSHAGAARLAADLARHPQICLPRVRRIGHFTPLRYGRPLDSSLEEYDRDFARWSGQRYRLEAGPDYFDGGPALVQLVADSLPGVRVVLILRDPVQRLWAGYGDKLARGRVPRAMSFENYLDRCLALRANGADRFEDNRHFRTLSSGFYVEFLPAWLEVFGCRARVVFSEDLRAESEAQLGALLDWLGLDPSAAAAPDPDGQLGEEYGAPEAVAAGPGRRWWPVGWRRTATAGTANAWPVAGSRRLPRHSERVLAGVRALYADANAELAALLRDRGYDGLPEWLAGA